MKRNLITRRSFVHTSVAALGAAACSGPLIATGAVARLTAANSSLNLALVGCGGQGRGVMNGLLACGAHLVALCDPDREMIDKARAEALASGGEATKDAKAYEDYRLLLDNASSFDAVLVGTPDHWHAPLCKAFMKAGKHVYCEKPLTHSVAEARELRELSRSCNVVTQMGNQGSASKSLRRCTEIIRAGALGPIEQIYEWGIPVAASEGSAEGEDPVPQGFNWDLWVGPSALRPFKKDVYHPFQWRQWFDFGNGGLADFCCHTINLPLRALDLDYPEKIVVNMQDGKQLADKAAVEFHFPARGSHPAVTLHWQGNGRPSADVLQPLIDAYGDNPPDGLLIVGEKGCIYTNHWNEGGLIRLQGEPRLKSVHDHDGTRDIPETLPRTAGHGQEWIDACRGQGKTFSDFDFGGKLTEIGLAGVVGIRAGRNLDWDGEKMEATNAPEAARFVRTEHRTKWLV
ncbi:MAG: Gfo/Idh/MocA family protein [Pirellulaceae bacterium]